VLKSVDKSKPATEIEAKVMAPVSALANRSENHRYGESSQTTEDLTLINFELSKDVSQSYCLGPTTTTSTFKTGLS